MSLLTLIGLLDPLNISNNANATDSPFQSFDEYIARGSGWTLKRILHMEVYTMQHIPIGGSSYFPLPDALQGSKSIVDMKNKTKNAFFDQYSLHFIQCLETIIKTMYHTIHHSQRK